MMRTNTFARVALLVGLVWAAGACDDGLTEINQNPNAPTDVPVDFLLPQAIQSSVQQTFGAGLMLQHTGIWPQHFVQIQYPDEETGTVRASRMEGYWTTYYAGSLKDIQTVIDKAVASGNTRQEAVGRIWRAWIFHIVTDLWGDVPYSQALQGEDAGSEGFDPTAPVYDTQASIYQGLLDELTAAVALLPGTSGQGFGDGDLIYGNDFDAWRRFANSLRMRLAMRLSAVDAATAQAEFVAAYNAGPMQSNADNALLEYPGAPYENPLYENYLGRDDNGISATMVDTLASLGDPRLQLYAEPATYDGAYRGHENGHDDLPEGQSLAWFSRIGDFWRADGASTPSTIMTYSEVLFLQAEAAERGWIAGGSAQAATYYLSAITASMNQWDAYGPANAPTDSEITNYLASAAVAYNGLSSIYLQKWISLWMNGSEAFAEWRRTGVPDLAMGPDLKLSRIPVRFSYPDSEQSLNQSHMQEAVTRQGGGLDLVTPVWWDAN